MWGYQPHFRIGKKSDAERIFKLLDERLCPEVFLVGVLTGDGDQGYPACVEPESDFWTKSEEFNSTLKLAERIIESYPERKMIHSHPRAQKWHDESLFRRSIRDAIKQTVEANPNKPSEFKYFVSYPSKVDGYLVSLVLGLQKIILDDHPCLQKGSVPMHECRDMTVSISLLDAVVGEYLGKVSGDLNLPDPGSGLGDIMNAEEIVRDGAKRLMTGLAYRVDQDGLIPWSNLLESCTNIAHTYYEGGVARGNMVLAHENNVCIEKVVGFENAPKLCATRAARKLLQLASQDFALHTNSDTVYGLVNVKNNYNPADEDVFKVCFLGRHHWRVIHNDQVLMGIEYGQPYLLKSPFDEIKLKKDIPRIFGKMTEEQVDSIVALAREAEKEKHGTMLVISAGAKCESERLETQGTCISPTKLTPELLRNLTPIDGAILLNPEGECYAIGVVLDGMANEIGNPARGARYNSAIRYVTSSKHPCLAIVVSEDGGVDFFPNLKPMIRRSHIENAITSLRDVLKKEKVTRRKYNEVLGWLKENSFYLLAQDCCDINELMEAIEEKLKAEDPMAMRILRNKFVPDPDMDIELYYEQEIGDRK